MTVSRNGFRFVKPFFVPKGGNGIGTCFPQGSGGSQLRLPTAICIHMDGWRALACDLGHVFAHRRVLELEGSD